MARRFLLAVALAAFPVCIAAQPNDFGVWLNSTHFKSTTQLEEISGTTVRLKFDQRVGYGISFNHYSGPNVSTEFTAEQLRGEAKGTFRSVTPAVTQTIDVGSFQTKVLSAVLQWHSSARGLIAPYAGAGVAYFTGAKVKTNSDLNPGEPAQTFHFNNKFNFALNAGVNFAVMPKMSVALDARYSPFKAEDKSDPESGSVDLNPFTIALGLRFRM